MSKRQAERQLTDKDDIDSLVGDEKGKWTDDSVASAEVMAGRKILKATTEASSTSATPAWPTFSFNASSASTEAAPSSFSWPSFSAITPTTSTTSTTSVGAPGTGEFKLPTFQFKATSGSEPPKWPDFQFRPTSTATTTTESTSTTTETTTSSSTAPATTPAWTSSFSSAKLSFPSFPSTTSEKKEDKPNEELASTPSFSWPTFSFAPATFPDQTSATAAPPTPSSSEASKPLFAGNITWPLISNPLAPAPLSSTTQSNLSHTDLTTNAEGKQETLMLTNTNKGILGVNIAPPKVPSEGESQVAPIVTIPSSSSAKLVKQDEVVSGEEGEKVEWTGRCKLYEFSDTDKNWSERGVGNVKLNVKDNKSARLIMRVDVVGRLLLNLAIFPGISVALHAAKVVRFNGINHIARDDKNGEEAAGPKLSTFLLRLNQAEEANKLVSALQTAASQLSSPSAKSEEKTEDTTEAAQQ